MSVESSKNKKKRFCWWDNEDVWCCNIESIIWYDQFTCALHIILNSNFNWIILHCSHDVSSSLFLDSREYKTVAVERLLSWVEAFNSC